MNSTVGIDLAASPRNTAIAAVRWEAGQAVLHTVHVNAVDDLVLHWMHDQSASIGVDCPFGWPATFVELVANHSVGTLRLPSNLPEGWRRDYVLRETDRSIHASYGLTPLSVAADRIAHVAIRFAALMGRLGPHIRSPLDGSGSLVEVYPAVALKVWGLPHRGYKGPINRGPRDVVVDRLKQAAPWLQLDSYERAVRDSDHVLDALVCALVARAKQLGRTELPTDTALARAEGWIHVPSCELGELLDEARPSVRAVAHNGV